MSQFEKEKRAYYAFLAACVLGILSLIGYGMSTTANNDPQAVCLTRPWLDVKPPC